MQLGVWQLLLILVVVLIFFGAGKLPRVMGDVGKGMRNLRQGLQGDTEKDDATTPTSALDHQDPTPLSGSEIEKEKHNDS